MDIRDEYFNWLCSLIDANHHRGYLELLKYLFNVEFTWQIRLDESRAADGIALRSRFVAKMDISVKDAELLVGPCSMLEMMIALSDKMETDITGDIAMGNRPDKWFWLMIQNSHMDMLNDRMFDTDLAAQHVNTIINHEFTKDGEGGLFFVPFASKDMRELDIWKQMQQYLIYLRHN